MSLRVIVIGAGIGGLGTALLLARGGHDVTVLERDDTPLPTDVEAAFAWSRRGAPQVRHSHAFVSRFRSVLRDHAPDVLSQLLAAGVVEHEMGTMLAMLGLPDGFEADDFTILASRRTTVEWVLRRAVLDEGIDLRSGVTVEGLVGETCDTVPLVTGVRLEDGSALAADLVVATTGRRGDVPRWLGELGVSVAESETETGTVYFSRFYRLADGHEFPLPTAAIGRRAGLSFLGYEADNRTFSITLVAGSGDAEMRSHLLDDDRYDATCRLMPELTPLTAAGVAEAITPVHTMVGMVNRLRRFTDAAGDALVSGFHAVGDAHTATNPLYGRGSTLALVQAALLADAIAQHGPGTAASRAYEAASRAEIEPWYHASIAADAAVLRAEALAPCASHDSDDELGRLLRMDVWIDAVFHDMSLAPKVALLLNLLAPATEILADPTVVAAFRAAADRRDRDIADRLTRPGRVSRTDVLAAA